MDNEEDIDWKHYRQYQWSHVPVTGTLQQQKKLIANTIVIVNQGTVTVMINGTLRLLPNQSFTYEGYPGEICIHNFDISALGGPAQYNVVFVTKNYAK